MTSRGVLGCALNETLDGELLIHWTNSCIFSLFHFEVIFDRMWLISCNALRGWHLTSLRTNSFFHEHENDAASLWKKSPWKKVFFCFFIDSVSQFSMKIMNNREIDLHVLFDANNIVLWIWIVKKKTYNNFLLKKMSDYTGAQSFNFFSPWLLFVRVRRFWFQPQPNTKKERADFWFL